MWAMARGVLVDEAREPAQAGKGGWLWCAHCSVCTPEAWILGSPDDLYGVNLLLLSSSS